MELTFTQCKQIAAIEDLRGAIEALNDQPEWISEEMDFYDIQAVNHGGCASGAYMPAVTYYQAIQTMSEHGDDVLDYIESQIGELPEVPKNTSWSGMAVFYLSYAVELWCADFADLLANVDWN
jgi:hypothetical protein